MTKHCEQDGCNQPTFDYGLCAKHVVPLLEGSVPNEQAKALIKSRMQGGRSINKVAKLAGTSFGAIQGHLDGKNRHMSLDMYKNIQAIEPLPATWNHPELIRRRLTALRAVGVTHRQIQKEGGPIHRTIKRIMTEEHIFIDEKLATRIREVYDRHEGDSVENAIPSVRNLHLPPPAAWDDIDDLDAKPEGLSMAFVGNRKTFTESMKARLRLLIQVYGLEGAAERLSCSAPRLRKIAAGQYAEILESETQRLRSAWKAFLAEQNTTEQEGA